MRTLLWEPVERLLPEHIPLDFVQGLTGEPLRRAGDVLTLHDMRVQLSSLAAVGIAAECFEIPEDDVVLERLLRERASHGIPVPLFRFGSPPAQETRQKEAIGEIGEETVEEAEQKVSEGARLLEAEALSYYDVVEIDNRDSYGGKLECVDLRREFTHLVRLLRADRTGPRQANRRLALLRWLAFAAAFPERIVTARAEDAERRAQCAAFLDALAGKKRDPSALRLRRAARRFSEARSEEDIADALLWIREAVLRTLSLPPVVESALLLPEDEPLRDTERRELIYLARAGTREMKILAAGRLRAESESSDARATCEQLAYDPDSWVRAAAGFA